MKSIAASVSMIAIAICLVTGSLKAQKTPPDKKILIVYLSRTNNTKALAEIIQKQVGGTLVGLELEKPYPENYQATVQQVTEENEKGFLPPLKTQIDSIEKFDVVFVGFPTWGMQLTPPMKSFLHKYNLSGKTIIPFNTNAGYGEGSSFETIKKLCPNSKILQGYVTKGGEERAGKLLVIKGQKVIEVENEVKQWLQKIKMITTDNLQYQGKRLNCYQLEG